MVKYITHGIMTLIIKSHFLNMLFILGLILIRLFKQIILTMINSWKFRTKMTIVQYLKAIMMGLMKWLAHSPNQLLYACSVYILSHGTITFPFAGNWLDVVNILVFLNQKIYEKISTCCKLIINHASTKSYRLQ